MYIPPWAEGHPEKWMQLHIEQLILQIKTLQYANEELECALNFYREKTEADSGDSPTLPDS